MAIMQENQTDNQTSASSNIIEISDAVYLNIKRITVCADLQDANGNKLGGGDYEAALSAEEIAALQIQNHTPITDKFYASV